MVINTKLASILRFLLPRQRYLQKFTEFYSGPRYCFTVNDQEILRSDDFFFSVSELLAYLENIQLTFVY